MQQLAIKHDGVSGDQPSNAELDRPAGRFSPRRGRFGLLLSRSFKDKALFVQRCWDTADDERSYIIALDDEDLAKLVEERKKGPPAVDFDDLKERFNRTGDVADADGVRPNQPRRATCRARASSRSSALGL